jgi:MFS family permease
MTRGEPVDRASAVVPTNVRYLVLLAATLTSILLYLDRVCIAEVLKYKEVKVSLGLSDEDVDWSYSAFFISYALLQVPSGWLSDRFGARGTMAAFVVAWSAFTALTGWAAGFAGLFLLRLGVGVAQAGAYPTCGSLLSRWMRALSSSVVAFGGRAGATIAPYLTSSLIAAFHSWRAVMALYGALGVAVAFGFWLVFREHPDQHPRCNQAERDLIALGRLPMNEAQQARSEFPTSALIRSASMWLMCVGQFTTNLGWAVLITKMPTYLHEVRQVPGKAGGAMATVVLMLGMVGMLVGGRLTDWTTARFGLRWGRIMLLVASRFIAAGAFMAIARAPSAWAATAAFGLVAFSTDLGVAGSWAYMQDVGGRHVGSILGWGNMWGNFGAALSAPFLGWVGRHFDANGDWEELFFVCALSFVISGLASLGIDATKPIARD